MVGTEDATIEAGVFYDVVSGCSGSVGDTRNDRIKSGFGLDFAIGFIASKKKSKTTLAFSMPLHNFLDPSYPGQATMKR